MHTVLLYVHVMHSTHRILEEESQCILCNCTLLPTIGRQAPAVPSLLLRRGGDVHRKIIADGGDNGADKLEKDEDVHFYTWGLRSTGFGVARGSLGKVANNRFHHGPMLTGMNGCVWP